ncbi:unnamed protein product [Notodromas monacha]|uniref:Non-specific serine/threonine protein kinase n=1 Tax=Notodromas monacha TaxID=399045 RepID=A0A7R9BI83_9CRUS|nr:unnamed protein product [Notodromas monacha]CAG0915982.1 unnamed protein product [Notodromas monacha]
MGDAVAKSLDNQEFCSGKMGPHLIKQSKGPISLSKTADTGCLPHQPMRVTWFGFFADKRLAGHLAQDEWLPNGDSALHIASRDGLTEAVREICENGFTEINALNVEGLSPLHLAARNGHIDVVRLLCLHGCDIKQRSAEGITAEVAAYAQGYGYIGELLGKLHNKHQLDVFIGDLREDFQNPSPVLKMKLLGSSGVGKSTLVETLKTGYIASWFRRSKSAGSAFGLGLNHSFKKAWKHDEQTSGTWVSVDSEGTMSPKNGKKEKWWHGNGKHGGRQRCNTADSNTTNTTGDSSKTFSSVCMLEKTSSVSLSFDYFHDYYTRGVSMENVKLSGGGEWSVWDFSGQECYFVSYDLFLGSSQCVHLVLFDASQSLSVAYHQTNFWLSFLRARLPIRRPWGHGGRSVRAASVILVGTHTDLIGNTSASFRSHHQTRSQCHLSQECSEGVESMREKLEKNHGQALDIFPKVFLLDCHAASSQGVKELKATLALLGNQLCEEVKTVNGFLMSTLEVLKEVDSELDCESSSILSRRLSYTSATGRHSSRRGSSASLGGFPVLPWTAFLEFIRSKVNPLSLESHVEKLVRQLQLMGRLVVLDSPRSRAVGWPQEADVCWEEMGEAEEDSSLVVLSPQWLGGEVIGRLLSLEFRGIARPSGVYSLDDFTASFTCSASQRDMIPLLEALQLCNQVLVLPERSPTIHRTRSTAVDLEGIPEKLAQNQPEEDVGDEFDRFFSQSNACRTNALPCLMRSVSGEDTGSDGADVAEPEVEVEFPSFNLLDREDCLCVEDLWRDEAMVSPHFVVCGMRLRPPAPSLNPFFLHIFAKVQVALRWHFEEEREWERLEDAMDNVALMRMRTISSNGDVRHCWLETASDIDAGEVLPIESDESVTMVEGFPLRLRQWSLGSRLDKKFNSCFVCLRQDGVGDYLDIYTRGPRDDPWDVFVTQHRVYALVLRILYVICPGVCMETHLLSMDQQTVNALPPVFAPEPHPPLQVARCLLDVRNGSESNDASKPTTATTTTTGLDVKALLCFGSQRVFDQVEWLPDLPVSSLPDPLVLQVAGLLDPPDPAGRDWALLALQMNLGDKQITAESARDAAAQDLWEKFQHAANPAGRRKSINLFCLNACGRTESVTSNCEPGCVCCSTPHASGKRSAHCDRSHATEDSSNTATLLQLWQCAAPLDATIGNFVKKLWAIERQDVADMVMRLAPLYRMKDTNGTIFTNLGSKKKPPT